MNSGVYSTGVAHCAPQKSNKTATRTFLAFGCNMCVNCQHHLQTRFCLRCDRSSRSGIDPVQRSYAVVAGAIAVGVGSLSLFIAIFMGLVIR